MPYKDPEKKRQRRINRRSSLVQNPICLFCGKVFTPKEADRISYCSRQCSYSHIKALRVARIALLFWTRSTRNKGDPITVRYELKCQYCGKQFIGRYKHRKWCDECVKTIHHKQKHKQIWEKERICGICNKVFRKQYGLKTSRLVCSKECNMIAKRVESRRQKLTYEMRKRASYVEPVWRSKVYARDGYRCGICGRKIAKDKKAPHPMAATLDHIVPISLGGEHSYANIRTAHFECNWKRGNKVNPNGEQQFLFG